MSSLLKKIFLPKKSKNEIKPTVYIVQYSSRCISVLCTIREIGLDVDIRLR